MNRYFLIFLLFSFISLLAVGISVYDSAVFVPDTSKAEGFGISPPYFNNKNLQPGDTYSQSITILRSAAESPAKAEIIVDAPLIADWIKIVSGNFINLRAGNLRTPASVTVNVPKDAKPGNYRGAIYFTMINEENFSGVGIRVGARADIDLTVAGDIIADQADQARAINDEELYDLYKGKIVISSSSSSTMYYISPDKKFAFRLENNADALKIIKEQGIGITDKNLEKIPLALSNLRGDDTDGDGLPDNLEMALGTDKNSADTDGDLFNDADEIRNGYSPTTKYEALPIDLGFARAQAGKIFLQVENRGQVWYINPKDNKRYFLATANETINVLKNLALLLSEKDFSSIFGLGQG